MSTAAESEKYLSIPLVLTLLLVQVSSRSDECPPWFILDITNNSAYPQCVCSQAMDSMITCNQRQRTSYVKVGHCISI